MTDFHTGRVSGDQDFGNNILLNSVNDQIRKDAARKEWQDKGDALKKQLDAYLEDNRLKDPVNQGPVVAVHNDYSSAVFVFEGDRYYKVAIDDGDYYDDDACLAGGRRISIEEARRCGLLAGVAEVDKEYKAWQLEDTRRRQRAQDEGGLKRLRGTYTDEELKQMLGINDA